MAWFGNGLGTGIDPGLLIRKPTPSTHADRLNIDQSSWSPPTAPRIDTGLSPPPKPAPFDWSTARDEFESSKDELDRAHALKKAEEWARNHESDGEYFRRTGKQRGVEEYHAEIRRQKAAKEHRDRMDAQRAMQQRAANFDWSTATDEFEASKEALDRQHTAAKAAEQARLDMMKRKPASYYAATAKPRTTKPIFSIDPGLRSSTEKPKIDQSSWSPTPRKPASYYAPTAKPRITKPILSPTEAKAKIAQSSWSPPTPRKPASYYVPSTKPTGVPGLPPPVLPATQVSLLDAKKDLNVVKPADKRPVPSYLTTAAYDNPGKRQPFDHKGWRFQDRVVAAVLPFNKPNREWEDPGEAVKASAKFRKALVDTGYSEKRRKYIDAKSRLENQKAALKTIKKNVKNLQDVEGLSGFGHTEHTPTGDLLEYWKKEESKAEAELVKLQAKYSSARSEEVNAGREVKLARNNMDNYLRRGPYTRDTQATLGGFLAMALGGLIAFNLIIPTKIKKKTRNLNPLYSVFA